ncbi:MAG: nucleotide sugar dehydrogenase [Gemmatimonadetes bacterium]|nr:nucleotide sugar dehydrogenase [Gemmatimonadota bacterium]
MTPFADRVATRQARICVVGLGYVGLPLAVEFADAGFSVVGIDVDQGKVAELREGRSYVPDVPVERIRALISPEPAAGRLFGTCAFDALGEADAVSICVPTPLNKEKSPDVSYILAAAGEVASRLHRGQVVVLESTTYPGTTRELLLPLFERTGLRVGEDFHLAFSPERVDPGNASYGIRNTPKVLGGVTAGCLEAASALYATVIERLVPVSSTGTAEMVKLLENTFRAVNIGLVNEVAIMCDRLGLDVWEVIDAASTKPYGFMTFYPGPGLGGHCIPVDPHYLSWKLKLLNYNARFIELAGEVNASMPEYVVEKITLALNEDRKPVRGSRVLLLGVAYKRDVNDVRESPALDVYKLLADRGAELAYHDPWVPELRVEGIEADSVPFAAEELGAFDCVVIVTDHGVVDYAAVAAHARLVVDCRNATRGLAGGARIVRL